MFIHDCGTLPVFIEKLLKSGKTSFRRYDRKVQQLGAYIDQKYRCQIDGEWVYLRSEDNLYYDARNDQQCFFDDGKSSETVLVHRVPFYEKFPHASIGDKVWYVQTEVIAWDDDNPSYDQYTGLHVNGDTCGMYIGYREDKNAVVILDGSEELLIDVAYIISISDQSGNEVTHQEIDQVNTALAKMQCEQAFDYCDKNNLSYGCLMRVIHKFHSKHGYYDEKYILAYLHSELGWDIEQFRIAESWVKNVNV